MKYFISYISKGGYNEHGQVIEDWRNWMKEPIQFPIPPVIYKVSEIICVHCGHRMISVRPKETKLKDLECTKCGCQGYIIETGEVYNDLSHNI